MSAVDLGAGSSGATGNAIVTALDEIPGTTGPLAGWRIGVKDNVSVAGVRSTRGSAFFTEHVAEHDAAVVTRLRAGGAGIVATLNMAEFALGVTSQNSVHGGVVNPWDPARIPGGSSGGSGAAVAGGLVDAALGTDTGGSVRLPASMCGITGLRPTYGTVPEDGVFPCCPETDVTGPLTRTAGRSDLDGLFFHMEDCVLSPRPSAPIDIVCAGQSERGMRFCAEYGDYNFILSPGINDPEVYREPTERLAAAAAESGRDVGSLPLFMAIMAETDEEAQATWASYHAGADLGALGYMADEGAKDVSADGGGTARTINLPAGAVNFNMATLVGSYETVARQIDQVATMKGVEGMMFTFDDFERGTRDFGEKVMPLLG